MQTLPTIAGKLKFSPTHVSQSVCVQRLMIVCTDEDGYIFLIILNDGVFCNTQHFQGC